MKLIQLIKRVFKLQSLNEDVFRQTEREKQLQQRYAELMEELKEISQQNGLAYINGNGQQ